MARITVLERNGDELFQIGWERRGSVLVERGIVQEKRRVEMIGVVKDKFGEVMYWKSGEAL